MNLTKVLTVSMFDALFGVRSDKIRENCVLVPVLTKGILKAFGVAELKRGRLYACAEGRHFTLIQTGMGTPFVGDAVLYLKGTPCKNVFLFGSCGALMTLKGLKIGDLVTPEKCIQYESFSDLLHGAHLDPPLVYPNEKLLRFFLEQGKNVEIHRTTCATLASLKIEEERFEWLVNQGVEIVDMECSAFFSAARHEGLNAVALFYVADLVRHKPFYMRLTPEEQSAVMNATMEAVRVLGEFMNEIY